MLFQQIITVYNDKHRKPINTFCGQNAELFIVNAGGTDSYNCALKS
jgi:hypothetical protein